MSKSQFRTPVFTGTDVARARMRRVGLSNRRHPDRVALAHADFDYAVVRLGLASQQLAEALDEVGRAKSVLTRLDNPIPETLATDIADQDARSLEADNPSAA